MEDEDEVEGEDEAEDAEDAAATNEDELLFSRFLPLLLLFVSPPPPPLEKAVEEEEEAEEEEAGLPAIVSSSWVGFQPGARRRALTSRFSGDVAKFTSAFAVRISLLVCP